MNNIFNEAYACACEIIETAKLNEGDVLLASRDLTPLRNTIREEVDNNANN